MGEDSSIGDVEKQQKNCYYSWMSLQAKNMLDLQHALITHRTNGEDDDFDHGYGHRKCNDQNLRHLIQKVIRDFEGYMGKRSELARRCSSPYFAPSWNTPLENALMWISGCRPSSFIRLIYALCGAETEILLSKFIDMPPPSQSPTVTDLVQSSHGSGGGGCSIGDLTSTQLAKINELHVATMDEEEKLTSKLASLQENMSDKPASIVAYYKAAIGVADVAVELALDEQERGFAEIVYEADKLRFSTLKKIVEILTTVQAADFLVASAKLHICMSELGKIRERRRHSCACPFAGDDDGST